MPIQNPIALLQRLCAEPAEREWLEFKVNNADPNEIGQYVSALANSAMLADRDRAYLVFGVEDVTKRLVGTSVVLAKMKGKGSEGFQNWLSHQLMPQLMIEYLDFQFEGLNFAILCIEPTYERPVRFAGTEYIHIGEHKKKLSEHPQHERALWLSAGRRQFEDAVCVSNVSHAHVLELLDANSYFSLTGETEPASESERIRKLEKLGAVRSNMEGGYDVLNLGAILLAKDIEEFPSLRGKAVRVIKYKGVDKRSSEPEREGRHGYAVGFSGLIKHIMNRSTGEEYIEGVRRRTALCPEVAVREVVANALIHQDFTRSGAGPIVEIYDNRIEVTNPGNSLIEPDRMIDERKSRNEKLASAMRLLGLCEERGGGLDKALMAIEDEHLPTLLFIPSADSMRVILL